MNFFVFLTIKSMSLYNFGNQILLDNNYNCQILDKISMCKSYKCMFFKEKIIISHDLYILISSKI